MKKLLAALMDAFGLVRYEETGTGMQLMDPKDILFSIPTIASDLPPLDPIAEFTFHEDEWAQIEFLPKAMLPEVCRMLSEFKTFEAQNREDSGWRNLYVRELKRAPLMVGKTAIDRLQSVLGAKVGPTPLMTNVEGVARIRNGFTIDIGRNVHLYGYADESGIPVIAAKLGPDPDEQKLTDAFMKLNANNDLILVDWRQQLALVSTTSDDKIEVWRP